MSSIWKRLPLLLALLGVSGCATLDGPTEKQDPLESFNRAMFRFNDGFDRHLLKPVAEGYQEVMPQPLNTSISNVFSNLDDVIVVLNDILQLKFEQTLSDLGRLTFNTTLGLLGIFDVASPMAMPKHHEDFGQTLGHWGVGNGPYLVLPFLGPSSARDGVGLVADWQVDPVARIDDDTERWSALTLKAIDIRAGLLSASRVLDTAALDRYTFLREAYLQKRNSLVYDGNPPNRDIDDFDPLAE